MFSGLGLAPLVLIFAVGGGCRLGRRHPPLALDRRRSTRGSGWARRSAALILLAVATNLPEIAITASAALSHNLGIAIGNILGGIAIQTVVLVVLDVAIGRGGGADDARCLARARARGAARDPRARDLGHGCAAARRRARLRDSSRPRS